MRVIRAINSTFLSLKLTVDTLIDVRNAKQQNSSSDKIKHITLLSDSNVPGYSTEQSTVHSRLMVGMRNIKTSLLKIRS